MKKSIIAFSLFIILLSQSVSADFKMPGYKKLTLKNGLTVLLMEQHEVPLIDIQMVTKAGAVNDGKKYGLATMTGNALTFGSGNLSKKQIEDLLAFYGANLSNRVAMESTRVNLSIASKDIDSLLPVFRILLVGSSFLPPIAAIFRA